MQHVESKNKCAPFKCRSEAILAGKADTLSITSGLFTLIKSHSSGSYDYVPGAGGFMSDDIPQADYSKDPFSREWKVKMRAK